MSAEADDKEILLDIPGDAPGKPDRSSEDEGVAALKARVEEVRKGREADIKAREEAERRAASATEEVNRTRQQMAEVQAGATSDRMNTVAAAIDSVTRESEQAMARMEKAALDGDYKALSAAQVEIARAQARLIRLEETKDAMQADAAAAKNRPAQNVEREQVRRDPVESYIATLTPRSAVYMAGHRDMVNPNGSPRNELVAAHSLAMAKGHQVDSDGYFAFIDRKLKEFSSEDNDNTDDGTVVDLAPRRALSMAAPVSRESASEQSSPTKVRLTKEQLDAAEVCGMTPIEYAKSLMDPLTKAILARTGR